MTFSYLDVADLVWLAEQMLGKPAPIRDPGLLGSAAARPRTTIFGEDAYTDVWTKAAALLDSIVNNHPLIDGNKRLGWLATAVFLELNHESVLGASNDDVFELVVNIAANDVELETIAARLAALGAST